MATGGEVKMKNPFAKKAPMVAKNPFVPDSGNLGATNGKGTKAFSSGLMATRDVVSSLSIDTLDDDEPHQQKAHYGKKPGHSQGYGDDATSNGKFGHKVPKKPITHSVDLDEQEAFRQQSDQSPVKPSKNLDNSRVPAKGKPFAKQYRGETAAEPLPFDTREITSNPIAQIGIEATRNYVENAVHNMQKNMDSFAARCFQIGAKKYFEVENQFVLRKLAFICFPFYKIGKKDTQEDDPQFEDQSQLSGAAEAAQETLKDVTDTDLYVPLMAFISYTILSCLYLGISSKFNPSLIASNFSNCLALTLIEALIFKLIIWTMLEFNPLYLQLLSVVSYKYLGLCFVVLAKCLGVGAFTLALQVYFFASTTFLVFKSIKGLGISSTITGLTQSSILNERKLNMTSLGLGALQILFTWILLSISI